MGKQSSGKGLGAAIIPLFLVAGLTAFASSPEAQRVVSGFNRNGLPSVSSIPLPGMPKAPAIPAAPAGPSTVVSPARVAGAKAALATLPTTTRVKNSGCRPGGRFDRVCAFGPAWTDDTSAPGGHNGCDTRNDVLAAQLKNVTYKTGTRSCVVMSGDLPVDPYTGKAIHFTKAKAGAVQIDHMAPLSAAWDLGAASWPMEKRVRFANDASVNLLAADGPANGAKSDQTPGTWLVPNNPGYRCAYAVKYIEVLKAYPGLKLDTKDGPALSQALRTCR